MKKALPAFSFLCILAIAFLLVSPSASSDRSFLFDAALRLWPNPVIAAASRADSLHPSLWISAAIPQALRQNADGWGIPIAGDPTSASLRLDIGNIRSQGSTWIYALVAPFPTVIDGVSSRELLASWQGAPEGPFAGHALLMDESTRAAFTALWGTPAPDAVRSVPADQLLDVAWKERPSWAIVPFESLDPRWKVLMVDDQSPVRKDFQLSRYYLMQTSFDYPLAIKFELTCIDPCPLANPPVLVPTNRDPAKMTTLIMTGVTALVRATAYTMNQKGTLYPGQDIHDLLVQADITHVSNEVPFADDCPPPNPAQARLVFCSDPRYLELLQYVGADVIELTGNHYADYGPDAMLETLRLYKDSQMSYYGGGADLEDARKPLLLENNGNKIAFIGCNSVDIGRMPTASPSRPGAAPCDFPYMTAEIHSLRDQGYLVITSFQYYETYAPKPFDAQIRDFRMVADAGATIVQGSQAHYPQNMEFYDGTFVHYGLGNLFFDQMGDSKEFPTRREFMDRHIFYDGRYISTELLTSLLEDFSRPRPMTAQERAAFLAEYFAASGW